MNKLCFFVRARIINLLCEGNLIRPFTFLTGTNKDTLIRLVVNAGNACMANNSWKVATHVCYGRWRGVTVWEIGERAALVEVADAPVKKRGPFKRSAL